MPKADHALITSTPSPQSRRSVLLAAGGLAAAGALGSLPALASNEPSPELLEYRRRKALWNACFEGDYEEDEEWEARVAETSGAVEEAIEPFIARARAPRSWDDVKEIAEVHFTELWDIEDGELHQHSERDDLDAMLLRAALAMGGAHV